jgi:hypothetical protein
MIEADKCEYNLLRFWQLRGTQGLELAMNRS